MTQIERSTPISEQIRAALAAQMVPCPCIEARDAMCDGCDPNWDLDKGFVHSSECLACHGTGEMPKFDWLFEDCPCDDPGNRCFNCSHLDPDKPPKERVHTLHCRCKGTRRVERPISPELNEAVEDGLSKTCRYMRYSTHDHKAWEFYIDGVDNEKGWLTVEAKTPREARWVAFGKLNGVEVG